LHFRLSLCIFVPDPAIAESIKTLLSSDRYNLQFIDTAGEFIEVVEEDKEKIDCLVVLSQISLLPLFNGLYEEGILLPVILLESATTDFPKEGADSHGEVPSSRSSAPLETPTYLYHTAEVRIPLEEIEQISSIIEKAITQFLHLGPNCPLSEQPIPPCKPRTVEDKQSFLLLQQRRLAEKLKERLGYLGVYYKRNPAYFYRNLSRQGKKELIDQLSADYRKIILNYFVQDSEINQEIDQFVSQTFFVDISVSQILEIHMELMDEFSQQLKLEGRSEDILLDYRLVLIDILAHLGEMYRRSIPREDIPYDLLFRLD
jgi:circadian clock protein KaiA